MPKTRSPSVLGSGRVLYLPTARIRPISYDAVVSAVSKAVTEQEVLSIVFVLEWGGE